MEADAVRALIAMGSNITNEAGTPREHLAFAVSALAEVPRTRVAAVSGVIQTDPVGPAYQPRYCNAAAVVETRLGPRALLDALLSIERVRGRDRSREMRWGPRTLDLDLILFGEMVIDEPGLTVPHPRLAERLFVLAPAAEVAGEMRVPTLGRTVAELLAALRAGAAGD